MWFGELFQEREKERKRKKERKKEVEFEIIACHIFTNSLSSGCNFHRIACWGGRLSCSWSKLRPYDRIDATVTVLPIVETSFTALRI